MSLLTVPFILLFKLAFSYSKSQTLSFNSFTLFYNDSLLLFYNVRVLLDAFYIYIFYIYDDKKPIFSSNWLFSLYIFLNVCSNFNSFLFISYCNSSITFSWFWRITSIDEPDLTTYKSAYFFSLSSLPFSIYSVFILANNSFYLDLIFSLSFIYNCRLAYVPNFYRIVNFYWSYELLQRLSESLFYKSVLSLLTLNNSTYKLLLRFLIKFNSSYSSYFLLPTLILMISWRALSYSLFKYLRFFSTLLLLNYNIPFSMSFRGISISSLCKLLLTTLIKLDISKTICLSSWCSWSTLLMRLLYFYLVSRSDFYNIYELATDYVIFMIYSWLDSPNSLSNCYSIFPSICFIIVLVSTPLGTFIWGLWSFLPALPLNHDDNI